MFWRKDSNDDLPGDVERALASALPDLAAKLRSELRGELEREQGAAQAGVDAKIDELVATVRAQLDTDPEARTRLLLATLGDDLRRQVQDVERTFVALRARIEDLDTMQRDAVAMLEGLERRTAAQLVRSAPERVDLGEMRQAKRFGVVSIWSDGGGTDVVELRVGFESPPEHVVGRVNTRNKINSSFTTIVRPGEWWTTTTEGSEWGSGVKITYTEFM